MQIHRLIFVLLDSTFGARCGVLLLGIMPTWLFGCVNSVPQETVVVPDPVELELAFLRGPLSTAGIPILSHTDRDGRVSRFMLDTGSEATTVSREYAAHMGFPRRCVVPYTVVGAENERQHVESVVRIDELKFDSSRHGGLVAFRDFDALVVDTPVFDFGVDGILGAPVLAQCTFTIDFSLNALRIETASLDRNLSHTTPIRIARGGLMYIRVELAGESEWALLDTGGSGSLGVPEGRWDDLPLKDLFSRAHADGFSFGGASRSELGCLDGVIVIANQRIEDPFVTSNPNSVLAVGAGLLQGFALTIDQRSRLARLVRSRGST